jgi:O-acetyl-ADP-ribose deacetylase (regulator of RNase III)
VPAILRVVEGDIATFDGDALVNAANNHLRMGTGVAGAILRKGGGTIQEECDEFVRRNGPLKVGEAMVTGAGDLSVRYVIHAAAMGDHPPTPESIRSATHDALRLAREKSVLSLAFPVLGSGVGGFPFSEAARIMVEEIRSFTSATPEMETVVFFGHDAEQTATLRRVLG